MLNRYHNHLLAIGLGEGTAALYCRRIEGFARFTPDVLDADLGDLERYLAQHRHLAAETRKSMRTALRSFYQWALREDLINADPTVKLEGVRIPKTVPLLAPDDALQFGLLTAPLDEQQMIYAGRMGCLRVSEIASLHMSSRHGDVFRVLGKGEKMRNVTINSDWMPVVLQLERELPHGYYLPGRWGGHLHITTIEKKVSSRTGYNPHALRHAGATAAFESSGDLRAVQELLGHASLATTERYLHTSLRAVRRATDGAAFKTAVTNPHDIDRIFRPNHAPAGYSGRFAA